MDCLDGIKEEPSMSQFTALALRISPDWSLEGLMRYGANAFWWLRR